MYSWGDPFDGSLANFCDLNCSEAGANQNFDDGSAEIAPVGSYLANGYGLFDIDGNVQEWVADWYGSYSDEVIENPSGPDSGDGRGVRGGAWLFSGDSLRVSLRTNSEPVRATYYYGFRCACSAMVDTTSPRTPAPTRPPISPSPVRATPTTTPAGPFTYMVQTGDTLALIAVSFNSEVSTLLALNPAIDPQTQALTIGQVILIPSSGTSIRAQTSTVDGMVMSYIPAGTFQMGEDIDRAVEACQLLYEPFATDTCSADWYGAEGPVHTVTLDAFWMDQTEVTNGMYAQCVESGACSPPGRTSSYSHSNYYGDPTYANYPVMFVNWEQAETYCEWAGRELPTEAQWEYAARGGLAGALYPWGDSFDGSLANFCDAKCTLSWPNQNFYDGYMDTAPSGSFLPNGYGLYDMAGNVFEWVADWYGDYSSSAVENPTGPDSGDAGIIRGGSWRSYGNELRVSYRSGFTPTNANRTIGFRCALSP